MNERELDELRAELVVARAQIEQLRQSNEQLQKYLRDKDDTIRQAKDITPVSRVSLKRVLLLVRAAALDLSKISKLDGGGWLLSMGATLQRKFRSLRQIWELLNVEDWYLNDLFDESIPANSGSNLLSKVVSAVSNCANWLTGGARQNSFETWNHFVNAYGDISSEISSA
ncbi:MAG: hypothetical protein JGK30_26030 [Microcoleus sp. PH2017_40_RAT_O_B]|uniref:hypothetical protein n=1 Tax=unclassified Microcoleus TaxID=2642155 RepID=UPI001D706EB0|nr:MULTISPECIES: hypothetical protein [unclassified Microcoleus]MCC3575258.1 hypothetical protein [Microcoleus sp. PH2017_34_RAT_O_A]MCC3612835.1 hypothetical protein [Microcoleus sp. PH2017_40_RAT_O_B]